MFTKYFYLVRHGETEMNKQKLRQGETGHLSPLGIQEVEELSKRLINMKIDRMFVSPFERTRETANIINKYLNLNDKKIIITDYIAERKNPTIIIGKKYDDPIAKSFIDTMDKSIHDPDLRIYDEENFNDLKSRTLAAQNFLISKSKKHNLCVTHGIFLKMFLSTILYGKDLSVREYVEMALYNPADNAGVTLVSYNPIKRLTGPIHRFLINILYGHDSENEIESITKYSPWKILAYNDYTRDGFEKLHI